MLRLTEIALFLAPFALACAWLVLGWRARWVLWAAVGALALLAAGLIWYGTAQRLPHGAHYVPAQMRDGKVVDGHGA